MKTQPFLINPPRKRRKAKAKRKSTTSRRKTTTRRKGGVPAWVKAKGYSSWSAYMASIRPNKGGKVAKRRKRRASAARPAARRRRRSVARPAAKRRRSYRRNSFGGGGSGIVANLKTATFTVGGVLAGKAGARIGRSALKISGGTPMGYAAEVGVGIVGNMVLKKFVGPRFAADFLAGTILSVVEAFVKNANIPVVSAALGDEGEGDLGLGDWSTWTVSGDDDLTNYLGSGDDLGTYDTADLGTYDLAEA